MANLSIRKLDDDVFLRFCGLASAHGVSIEEEVRRILKQAVAQEVKLGEMALHLFVEGQCVELQLPKYPAHEPLDLS